jgi:hypothetical protein
MCRCARRYLSSIPLPVASSSSSSELTWTCQSARRETRGHRALRFGSSGAHAHKHAPAAAPPQPPPLTPQPPTPQLPAPNSQLPTTQQPATATGNRKVTKLALAVGGQWQGGQGPLGKFAWQGQGARRGQKMFFKSFFLAASVHQCDAGCRRGHRPRTGHRAAAAAGIPPAAGAERADVTPLVPCAGQLLAI